MNGAMLLQHAAGVIEHRERIYGPPSESFDTIAARWSLVLGVEVSAAQVALFICKLRKKLATATRGDHYIETVWGRGYVLRDPHRIDPDAAVAA